MENIAKNPHHGLSDVSMFVLGSSGMFALDKIFSCQKRLKDESREKLVNCHNKKDY